LTVLVLVHELGHFLFAKAFHIKVLEFGFGFPPRLFSIRRGETLYSINLFPLGGFVKLLGEEDPSDPRSLAGKSAWVRSLVLGAGSFMNLLLPLLIFTLLFSIPQDTVQGKVEIQSIAPGSPADSAGIIPGDIVSAINGNRVSNIGDLSKEIRLNLGKKTQWDISRPQARFTGSSVIGGDPGVTTIIPAVGSEEFNFELIPRWSPPVGEGNAGIVISTIYPEVVSTSFPIWVAIPKGIKKMGETILLFRNEIIGWVMKTTSPQISGPIGIAQISGEVAEAGLAPLLELTALLSLNLAILNILPIPALDGGRLLFVFLEVLRRGRRIPPEKEGMIHALGFAVLVSFIIVVSYFDILRILRGESFLK
jgi:regulator of sigma E protease